MLIKKRNFYSINYPIDMGLNSDNLKKSNDKNDKTENYKMKKDY